MRKILLCLALCLSVPFISCIYAGKEVKGGNHSFVVSLQSKQNHHFCCGALITLKFILTAASCVRDRRPHDLVVVGGIRNLDDRNGTRMLIDKVISRQPTGDRDVLNNIAVMSLMEKIAESEYLHPISLAEDDDQASKVGKRCRIYGWGRKSKTANETNTLQNAVTRIRNMTKCGKRYGDVNGTLICIYDVKASLCQFDTGNPLISAQGDYLWGIATEQHWCGDRTNDSFVDIYTRVDSYKEWICKVVNENSASTGHKRQIILTVIIVLLMFMLN